MLKYKLSIFFRLWAADIFEMYFISENLNLHEIIQFYK